MGSTRESSHARWLRQNLEMYDSTSLMHADVVGMERRCGGGESACEMPKESRPDASKELRLSMQLSRNSLLWMARVLRPAHRLDFYADGTKGSTIVFGRSVRRAVNVAIQRTSRLWDCNTYHPKE